jgi:hypothetical protein
MATLSKTPELQQPLAESTSLIVSLPSLPPEFFDQAIRNLAAVFGGQSVVVASPDGSMADGSTQADGRLKVVGYTPSAPPAGMWTLTAADFLNAHELTQQRKARAVLILGAEAHSVQPTALAALAGAVLEGGADLAVPRYALPPRAGLVNSAILYPMTRALFGTVPRFPLAVDLCLSARMAERMATMAQKLTASNQPDALQWPVAEAAVAGFTIAQVEAGPRSVPAPAGADLNSVLAQVAGSLFADVDAKAAFWQRSRVASSSPSQLTPASKSAADSEDLRAMLDTFRIAYGNLHEIWSLVLPPQSLLGLKRLSVMPAHSFSMPDSLWARIIYDFLLAYRLRTINRGHLLGALTPLYLAWVGSHVLLTNGGVEAERHIEAVAAAFETDKPYLVSRWRWPDRFNP